MVSFYLAALESDADRQMFTSIYDQHRSKMELAAIKILKNQRGAEDALQNVDWSRPERTLLDGRMP